MFNANQNIGLVTDSYRGCVTPKQMENLLDTCGGNTDMVDGYDELPVEYQEKIEYALENGHVHDDDWKGVSPAFFLATCPYILAKCQRSHSRS